MINKIEQCIDETNVEIVLNALITVLQLKGEHLAVNWQDYEGAKSYRQAAFILDNATSKITKLLGY